LGKNLWGYLETQRDPNELNPLRKTGSTARLKSRDGGRLVFTLKDVNGKIILSNISGDKKLGIRFRKAFDEFYTLKGDDEGPLKSMIIGPYMGRMEYVSGSDILSYEEAKVSGPQRRSAMDPFR